jgi:hypothetical protein
MANIATLLNTIKNAVYGKDMRLALHDAIKATNDDVETKEPKLTAGTVSQYYRGDKTWQDLPTRIRNTSLAGLSTSNNSTITSLDTVLIAFGKLQAQMNTTERSANKGVANGYASLDDIGKVPVGQLPDIAITNTFVVSSQSAMLALTAQIGDVAVRTDLNKSFILKASPSTTLANWQELLTPTDTVLSVNGKTGVVALTKADVGLNNVDNTADSAKNVYSASRLTTARTINGVSFDGTANITIYDNTVESKIMEATSVSQTIEDSIGSSLLDSNGNTILGTFMLIDMVAKINEDIESALDVILG